MIEILRDLRTGETKAMFTIRGDWGDRAVSVVGSFNRWTPGVDRLRPGRDGTWSAVVAVPDGHDLHFRYLATGDDWFDDPDADLITEHGSTVHWPPGPPAPSAHAAPDADRPAAAKPVTKKSAADTTAARTAASATAEKAASKKATTTKAATRKAATKRAATTKADTKKTTTPRGAGTKATTERPAVRSAAATGAASESAATGSGAEPGG